MIAPGKIKFKDIEMPQIEENQLLIKIKRVGICGSDIHVYYGKHPFTSYPVVQGHEVSGVVAKVGGKVSGYKTGDKVTIQPQVVCGKCYMCNNGNYHICDELKVMGFQAPGAAAEYFAVDADKVHLLPPDIGYDEGAMVEPLAVAVHSLNKAGDLNNKNILVLGAGPVGNLVAQAAKGKGAARVMITDISNYRLELARRCNIDYCINTMAQEPDSSVLAVFGPERSDLILECVGAQTTIEQAVRNARKGTDIIVVGVFGEKVDVDLGLLQDRELRLTGTLMYKEQDYREAIALIKEKKVNLAPLITNWFGFSDYINAYKYISAKKDEVMKVMIVVSE